MMLHRSWIAPRRRAVFSSLGRSLLAAALVAALALEFLPCTGPCALGVRDPAAPVCLSRLHLCGAADHAPGSLADQSILRSEPLLLLQPALVRSGPSLTEAPLPDGHAPPVYRPPRRAA